MKKLIAALFVLLLVLSPQKSYAHSGLEKSDPAAESTVTDNNVKFKLTFNTEIEDLSRIRVTDASGKEVSLIQTGSKGNELVGESENPMPNGTYNVYWKIIGEDSHVVQGTYKFTVKAEEQNVAKPPAAKNDDGEKTKSEVKTENEKNTPEFSSLLYILVGLAAFAVVLGLIIGKRKK